ncbi:hypothetical protein ACQI4L_09150 [Mycolicibacterium litorale]|uniref:hypothetical protein n=1 Tax=Mycolicibacterium litorale TaxID=758802 RepID=UPI003CFA6E32
MARNRQSAKSAGAKFERSIADYLAQVLDDRIDRRVKTGARDCGDIAGVRTHDNQRVVIECKNTARATLPAWTAEAHTEANNDGALVGVVIHKRHGTTDPGRQWVAMTVDDLAALLTGARHGHRSDV